MVAFKSKLVLIPCVLFSMTHSKIKNYFCCFFPALSKMVKDAAVLQLWEKDRDLYSAKLSSSKMKRGFLVKTRIGRES